MHAHLLKKRLEKAAKKAFRPEFLNRVDELIVFRQLGREDLDIIVHAEVGKIAERLDRHNIGISLDKKAIEFLITKGYNPEYGARPLRRTVERHIEDPLAENLLRKEIQEGMTVYVSATSDDLKFTFKASKKKRTTRTSRKEKDNTPSESA